MRRYRWWFDRLHGVGRFVRESDGDVSLMETGVEAHELNQRVANLMPDEIDALGAKAFGDES